MAGAGGTAEADEIPKHNTAQSPSTKDSQNRNAKSLVGFELGWGALHWSLFLRSDEEACV